MMHGAYGATRKRQGTVYLLSLILLVAFSALGMTLGASTFLELRKSDNVSHGLRARLAAESGMAYMLVQMDMVRLPSNTTEGTFITNLQADLADVFTGTSDVSSMAITKSATSIAIPEIALDGASFTTQFVMTANNLTLNKVAGGDTRCRMTVTGRSGLARRTATIEFTLTKRPVAAFDYGIASKGRIRIAGNGSVQGVNTGNEATVFSMSGEPVAIEAGGSADIGGDLFVTSDDMTSILLGGGGLTVAGESDIFAILANHAHFGVAEPAFPVIDITPFSPMTTSVIDASTVLPNQDLVLDNVRIKAGTNPIFKNNAVINGVLYIESPNNVQFNAGTTINAIIVCEDDPTVPDADKTIEFRGHVSAPGVGALPDEAQFMDVKEQIGTSILAPGFSVTFRGTTNSINGTIAADQLAFIGNSDISGELSGSIIGLKDREMILQGNAKIRINRETTTDTPAGFNHPLGMVIVEGTYSE